MPFGKKRRIDIERGKSLYFEYYGNKFGINRDLGDEYKNCNIPEDIETQWKMQILSDLEKVIDNSFGVELQVAVDRYMNLLNAEPEWLMLFLKTKQMDTFTAIIFCEELKNKIRLLKDKGKSEYIRRFLDDIKAKLLNQPITIDKSYINAEYMRNYDFSDDNIKQRINSI